MPKSLFLDPERADADGLVGVGGDLSPTRLLEAYTRGIFPWFDETTPILWWSPDPRAVFELDGFHVSRRLARTIRSGRFTTTVDAAFAAVIRGCADRPGHGIWITPDMIDAYTTLHRLGWAHSVEAWRDGELAGGVYGVAVGGLFAGESMFTRIRDGSKVALDFPRATAARARLPAVRRAIPQRPHGPPGGRGDSAPRLPGPAARGFDMQAGVRVGPADGIRAIPRPG